MSLIFLYLSLILRCKLCLITETTKLMQYIIKLRSLSFAVPLALLLSLSLSGLLLSLLPLSLLCAWKFCIRSTKRERERETKTDLAVARIARASKISWQNEVPASGRHRTHVKRNRTCWLEQRKWNYIRAASLRARTATPYVDAKLNLYYINFRDQQFFFRTRRPDGGALIEFLTIIIFFWVEALIGNLPGMRWWIFEEGELNM